MATLTRGQQTIARGRINHPDLWFDGDFSTVVGNEYRRETVGELIEGIEELECEKCGDNVSVSGFCGDCNHITDRPAMEAIAQRHEMWMKFWNRRGSNPITEVVEEYAN